MIAISTFKTLFELLGGNRYLELDDFPLNHLRIDSRKVEKGDVFVAIKGHTVDGRAFIPQAISAGAVVVITETNRKSNNLNIEYLEQDNKSVVPKISVFQLSQRLSLLANDFYDSPSKKLSVIGVTGTNGKTTVTQLIAQCTTLLNNKTAILGTIGNGIYNKLESSINTTASAIDIQSLLADFVKKQVNVVAMEISSHGLAMGRVKGLNCSATVFTNLSRDHLDFHKTMGKYAKAKWSLFSSDKKEKQVLSSGKSIVNYDDKYGKRWIDKLPEVTAVSCQPKSLRQLKSLNRPYVGVSMIEYHDKGAQIHMDSSWGNAIINSQLLGEFNVSNLLLSIATLLTLDYPFFAVVNMACFLKPICGRMEVLHENNGPTVIVDYAHTPDALQKALQASRIHCQGTLWVIFGCGGDRDTGKRPLMAEIAEQFSDKIVLTNDNPRTEDEMKIIHDIQQGLHHTNNVQIITDRVQAIGQTLKQAGPNDVILIAGKGHEDYQIIGKTKYRYSDQETVKQLLGVENRL
ncbi:MULTISPECIES: UDP-N-acetylmuramoyl-L-alanyl-D-glutamate--2,6-diaminopimelate ligase [unclassified Gilliamella]|uniref:UDP-N-acetylmuramoyl-L-alanyl-D-glutamate--2, 6-diaminopimelate ligase n=1 Tax=unclassified Gilliamella TaxID=2685620 RepID=UPI00132B8B1E|nr:MULTISPECIES: UDP-N-acetylmuramoyl-L-alanyl-D-glutamate--2,6-diaminopimelate ligase [unclassified Gilliamella]MWN31830.1 UDP-N-acetylmuramoyl-L-alanyl-D-glutamate--2,6-diaminopimelate ligase [Gilliamella sp. Pra-s60]MWP28937.1 UDP-N-acetylmuramoyl-L-alanyl-D-glutamate--2,6-diaminopimelate ligase [Gilliamella sp. Pra-s54]